MLEIGCGTGRNLAQVAQALSWHGAAIGLDISRRDAGDRARRARPARHVAALAQSDATGFDAQALFGRKIRPRRPVLRAVDDPGLAGGNPLRFGALAPGGQLHIVDFGSQRGLPRWFRRLLYAWLARFEVTPRFELEVELRSLAAETGASVEFTERYRSYCLLAIVRRAQ